MSQLGPFSTGLIPMSATSLGMKLVYGPNTPVEEASCHMLGSVL